MNTPVKVFMHPLDRPGRQRQEQITQALSEFVAPGIRQRDLQQTYEQLPPDLVRQLIFALQGVPGNDLPLGGS